MQAVTRTTNFATMALLMGLLYIYMNLSYVFLHPEDYGSILRTLILGSYSFSYTGCSIYNIYIYIYIYVCLC